MSEPQWHVVKDGAQQGPFPESIVRQMATTGQLRPLDMVWREGMPQWTPAHQVPGLFPAGTGAVNYDANLGTPEDIGQNAGMRMLLPVGRSGWAIAAGYLGLFSLIIFPAPICLIISIIAIYDIRKHPQRHGMGRAIFGLIMGLLGSIFCGAWLVATLLHR